MYMYLTKNEIFSLLTGGQPSSKSASSTLASQETDGEEWCVQAEEDQWNLRSSSKEEDRGGK